MTANNNVTTLRTEIVNAIAARLASAKAQTMTDSNRKKLIAISDVVSRNDATVEMLLRCNYNAQSVNDNVYSVVKVFDIARTAINDKVNFLSIYCNAFFDSALVLEKAKIEITRDVVASLCTNDVKTKYDAKIKTTRVQSVKSNSTVATQHNSTINAFLELHMLNVSRDANNDDTFTLNRDNAAVQQIAALKQIALVEVSA